MAHFAELNSSNEVLQVITSYNNNFRKQYAGIGYSYDSSKDKFITPQPYPSWSLNSNDDWHITSYKFPLLQK
jgi:hypothetical protein